MPEASPTVHDRRRVVVTGVGLVTTLGTSREEILDRLARGEVARSRPVPATSALRAAAIEGFEARPSFRQPKAIKLTDRKTQLAVAAAARAVADAGLAGESARDEWAIILGCSASDVQIEDLVRALGNAAPERAVDDLPFFAERVLGHLNPLWLLINLPNMVGAHVGIQLGSSGPNHTLTGDWVAGAQALGEAYLAIASGERDVALAGGADAPLTPFDLGCLASDPRFTDAPPFLVAEGAAVWVLEERDRARRRGARELGEICGYAATAALAGETHEAIRRAASRALEAAGWSASQLAALAPAGCPAHPFEPVERRALELLLLDRDETTDRRAAPPARFEIKQHLGHALAAAGPIDGALLLAELSDRTPTANGAARGLALTLGTLGQCVALALAGADKTEVWQ